MDLFYSMDMGAGMNTDFPLAERGLPSAGSFSFPYLQSCFSNASSCHSLMLCCEKLVRIDGFYVRPSQMVWGMTLLSIYLYLSVDKYNIISVKYTTVA